MEAPSPADDARAFLNRLFADAIRPDPRRSVAEWAEAERVVAEGANEGPWRNRRAPYLVEIMERCSLHCPTRRVSFLKSAQVGGTQVGLNLLGQILTETPAHVLVALPSINSLQMYNRDKLDRMIQASPRLKRAVADITERSGAGSTVKVKRGARGAQVELVTASSSKDLQSRTCRVIVMEEVSEFERDVGGRGDPVEQLLARTIQWRKRGEKVLEISTPGIKSEEPGKGCRISKAWEAGSRGSLFVPCPSCGHHQTLRFPQLKWPKGHPSEARYACEACGVLHDETAKRAMLEGSAWVHEHPERLDLHASYKLNILASDFTPWAAVAEMAEKVEDQPAEMKTFVQQWLGEAWDEAADLPKAEILLTRREAWKPGTVPPGVLFLMGATDVQGDRLVWAVWGFDRHFGQWLVDTGTLEGDPTLPTVWQDHDALLARSWVDAWGRPMRPESWGIDTGYLSSNVYAYVRRHGLDRTPQLRALDGRKGWSTPALGTPKHRDFDWNGQKITNGVLLWPVGTWPMKSELASALRLTETGPGPEGWPRGAVRFNQIADRAWLDELLSEQCVENPRTGERKWDKVAQRNEAWDLAVYCRAQARHATLGWGAAQWDGLAAKRLGPEAEMQADMRDLWAPSLPAAPPAPAAPTPPPHIAAQIQQGRRLIGPGRTLR